MCLLDVGFNFDFGYMNFDYMGWFFVMLFQFFIMDFWENIYDKVEMINMDV